MYVWTHFMRRNMNVQTLIGNFLYDEVLHIIFFPFSSFHSFSDHTHARFESNSSCADRLRWDCSISRRRPCGHLRELVRSSVFCGGSGATWLQAMYGCGVTTVALLTVVAPRVFSLHCGEILFYWVWVCPSEWISSAFVFVGSGGDGGWAAFWRAPARC